MSTLGFIFQITACKESLSMVVFVWDDVQVLSNPWHSATWLNKYLEHWQMEPVTSNPLLELTSE
jgi:hypothetical protein